MTTTPPVLDLLDWLAAEPQNRPSAATCAALIRLGADVMAVGAQVGSEAVFAREVTALVDALDGRPFMYGDAPLVDRLALVGHAVLAEEPENIEEWAAVAELLLARAQSSIEWRSRFPGHEATGPAIVETFRAAGRGPAFAFALGQRALVANVPPDEFGLGTDMTPALFAELCEAGIRTRVALDCYLAAGLDVAEAIGVAREGVSAGAATVLASEGAPVEQWVTLAGGLPRRWFPTATGHWFSGPTDPIADGMRARGLSWELLRKLHDAGWDDLNPREVDSKHGALLGRSVRTRPCAARGWSVVIECLPGARVRPGGRGRWPPCASRR